MWFGHVERKDDNDWVKRCITWEVEGIRQRGRPKKTWWDCIQNDMESLGLSQKDAQSRNKWRKRIKGGGNWLTQVHLEKWPLNGVCVFSLQHVGWVVSWVVVTKLHKETEIMPMSVSNSPSGCAGITRTFNRNSAC